MSNINDAPKAEVSTGDKRIVDKLATEAASAAFTAIAVRGGGEAAADDLKRKSAAELEELAEFYQGHAGMQLDADRNTVDLSAYFGDNEDTQFAKIRG